MKHIPGFLQCIQTETRDLYYEAGFGLSEVTFAGFQYYNTGSLLTGANRHGNLSCSGACYVQEMRSRWITAQPTDSTIRIDYIRS